MPAITWHDDALYIAMNNRDQLDVFWPSLFTPKDNAERPPSRSIARAGVELRVAVLLLRLHDEDDDAEPGVRRRRQDGGRCSMFTPPAAAFPAHWAPVDVKFYTGSQFPAKYRNGAFIAFHGSWNRAPEPQAGYNVTVPAVRRQQAGRRFRSVRAGLHRQGDAAQSGRRPLSARRHRAGAGRHAVYRRQPEGQSLAASSIRGTLTLVSQ
jgi:hypothetical protein